MQEVFGEGEVNQLFGYHGHSGTKTVQATQLLKDAKEHLSTLEANENSYSKTESLESKKQKILLSARKRLAILEAVDFVFNQEEYRKFIKDENVRTLGSSGLTMRKSMLQGLKLLHSNAYKV